MRNDFYNQFVDHTTLQEWLDNSPGPINVPKTLARDEVTAIVQKPAEIAGLKFEDGLTEIIVRGTLETTPQPDNEEPELRVRIPFFLC